MSKEREVIYAMIKEREEQVKAKHRESDKLYAWYDFEAWDRGAKDLNTEICKLYDEILLLKTVLARAED